MNDIYNIEKLRMISNPMLVASMSLVTKDNSEANKKVFIDELKRSTLLVQLYITPEPIMDETGKPKLAPDSKFNIPVVNMHGKKYFAVYTDLGEIRGVKTDGKLCIVPHGIKQLAKMVVQAKGDIEGIIINPTGSAVVLDAATIGGIFNYLSKTEGSKDKE